MFPKSELDNYKLQVELLQEKLQRRCVKCLITPIILLFYLYFYFLIVKYHVNNWNIN